MSEKHHTLGEDIYTGTAEFGRVWSIISAVMGTVFSILLIIGGIYIIYHKNHLKSDPNGRVDADPPPECHTIRSGDDTTTTCSAYVSYIANGKDMTNIKVGTGSTLYDAGQTITIYYDPATPDKPETDPAPDSVGWVVIGVGIFMLIGVWVWAYLANKYKAAAAMTGVGQFAHMLRR